MKCVAFAVLAVALVAGHRLDEEDNLPDVDIRKTDVRNEFAHFIRKFRRSRGNLRSNADVKKRYQVFAKNLHTIKKHNKERSSYRMEINDFADKTLRERQQFTGLANFTSVHKRASTRRSLYLRDAVPDAYDHRDDRHVTEVHNQGNCGSCWTYGVVYPLEGAVSILSGKAAVELSQQEILSCAYEDEEDRNGCNGGWYMDGWDYVRQSGRLATLADEPYLGIDMHCDPDINDKPNGFQGYKVVDWERVPKGDDTALAAASSKNVVAVAVESLGLFFYDSGIFLDEYCETPAAVDHAVTLVGYSSDTWIVKNSWGVEWGEKGYVRMARSLPSHCGIADYAYYPLVEKDE